VAAKTTPSGVALEESKRAACSGERPGLTHGEVHGGRDPGLPKEYCVGAWNAKKKLYAKRGGRKRPKRKGARVIFGAHR